MDTDLIVEMVKNNCNEKWCKDQLKALVKVVKNKKQCDNCSLHDVHKSSTVCNHNAGQCPILSGKARDPLLHPKEWDTGV